MTKTKAYTFIENDHAICNRCDMHMPYEDINRHNGFHNTHYRLKYQAPHLSDSEKQKLIALLSSNG